jgi:hypothetical protein
MSQDQKTKEVQADPKIVKKAVLVFCDDQVLIECPFCGKTLIRTNYERVKRLLHVEGVPRAKQCPKCSKLAALVLSSHSKKIIREKTKASEKPSP